MGFGYVGCCLGVALAERGTAVVGVESDPGLVEELRAGRCHVPEPGVAEALSRLAGSELLSFTTDYDVLLDADVVVIAVGTPVDEHGTLVTDQLEGVCWQIAQRLRPGQLVIVKSTVVPGTTRTLVAPLLEQSGLAQEADFGLVCCPERLAEGEALTQLGELTVLVGGDGPEGTAAAVRFWERTLSVPTRRLGSSDAAETVKLATNWWIDANIAVANELARFCAVFDVDVMDVIGAANSLPKGDGSVNILRPGIGVGGACLTKDPWMAWKVALDRGVRLRTVSTAREVNDAMPGYTAQTILDELVKIGRDPAAATVAVLGVAFKGGTGDLRNTPVRGVVERLRSAGAKTRMFDPLADPGLVRAQLGDTVADTLEEAVRGADAVAFLAGHPQWGEITPEGLRSLASDPCLVFDGRAHFTADAVDRLRGLGLHYRGVGR
ncbi:MULTISPECIES: nucleotide sugar dehydrogenase [unclassified Nocardiopsis]|uniref:nucleotide sugar dehydrogenase n=1 Tax=unclassified Nocardiopsis TaxID=2649073 RepID=UPI001F3BD8B9|nr:MULTISPECIES: nucleotide sugar dehydrogenase [unclassified Nocardiopsis]